MRSSSSLWRDLSTDANIAGRSLTLDGPPLDPARSIVDRVREIARENERLFERLIEGERRFRGLARAVWKVQEEERRRLARELHDGIGQTLTALKNQLERLREPGRPERRRRAAIGELIADRRASARETRELSRLLRPPVLDDLGLRAGAALARAQPAQRVDARGRPATSRAWTSARPGARDTDLPRGAGGAEQRAKHSGAARAHVSASRDAQRLRVLRSRTAAAASIPQALSAGSGRGGARPARHARPRGAVRRPLAIDSAPGAARRFASSVPLTSRRSRP